MTRFESRGLLVLINTLIAIISGSILVIKQPDSWQGLALLVAGFVTGWFSYRHLKFNRQATPEEKAIIEKQEEKTRTKITIWLMAFYIIVAILAVIAVGVGLILNASMGGELGHTIIRYAVYIGAGTATLFLGSLVFFA